MIDAKDLILNTYNISKKNKSKFQNWVNQMFSSNLDCKRIIISIAIDTHFKLVETSKYKKLFEELNYDLTVINPNELLEEAINRNPNLHFYSKEKQKDKNAEYIRVISFEVLIYYYLNKSSHSKIFMDDDKKLLRNIRFRKKYQNINVSINKGASPKELVFITNKIEFEAKLKSSHLNVADTANKFLGLRRAQNEEIVYLIYQKNFDVEVMQPITVNSDMSKIDNVYISFKKHDKYGRTRNHDQDEGITAFKEKVHKPILKSLNYNWDYLGIIKDDNYKIIEIVTEANIRLNEK